jgi:hypothetical protein
MPRLRRMSRSSIESLEQRICPSVTVAQIDLDSDGSADDLRIVGGNEGTKIKITDEGVGQGSMLLDLDINGDGDFADVGDLQGSLLEVVDDTSVIELQLGGGNDEVSYALSGALTTSQRRLSVDLGKGNDEFSLLAFQQFVAAGSQVEINLLAGAGNDQAEFVVPAALDSSLLIEANMGAGNDNVLLSAPSQFPARVDLHATFEMNIELGSGRNTVRGLLSMNVGGITQGDASINIVGGSGIDDVDLVTSTIVGNGLRSTFNLNAELGSGNDFFNNFISHLDVHGASEHSVRASGGSGNDVLNIQSGFSEPAQVHGVAKIDFIGGAGNDQLRCDFDDAGQLLLLGQLRVKMDGQDGTDQVDAHLAVTAASTGNYSLVALGGGGKDKLVLGLQTNGAALTYGLDGTLVIDGGLAIDQLQTTVPEAILEVYLVETFL